MINLDAALEVMEGDREILESVVEAFIEETPELLRQLDQALASGDHTAAQRAAHTIKGGLRILRLQDEQEGWAKVEAIAKDGNLNEIGGAVEEARKATSRVLAELTEYLAQ